MPTKEPHGFTCAAKIGDRAWCSTDAVALVSDDVFTWFDPTCDDHLAQTIRARMTFHPRAKLKIRNAKTWHVVRDHQRNCADPQKCAVHHPGSVIPDRSR